VKKSDFKITHLITTLDHGGAESMMCKLILGPTASYYRHSVICLTGWGKLGKKLVVNGIPVYCLGLQKKLSDIGGLVRLVVLLRKIRPKILQTWLYHADLIGLIAGLISHDCRVVWNIRCSDLNLNEYGLSTRLFFSILAHAAHLPDAVIFNSNTGCNFHRAVGYKPKLYKIIHNGFDSGHFCPNPTARSVFRQTHGIADDTQLIGMVSRYDPMKDFKTFFEAAERLCSLREDVEFVLVGKGLDVQNAQIKSAVKKKELIGKFHLLGERDDLAEIYPAFDISTLTSISEGFPNVLGEAMSCAVPCIATNVGDCADILGKTGKIVPPQSPKILAQAWDDFLRLPDSERRKHGMAARDRIKTHFSLDHICRQYERLYESML
jgi:glycosyltransferase involved in cell wall biosynthesis